MPTRRIDIREKIDRRYLGAVRLADQVTGRTIRRSLHIASPRLAFFRNRSGLHVIASAAGLESHTIPFLKPPAEPDAAALPYPLTVRDPLGMYLPRTFELDLPRNTDPDDADSLFRPVDIRLVPAPSFLPAPNWSVVRAGVFQVSAAVEPLPLCGVLLRITHAEGELLGSGMSDRRGEAAVMVPGVPMVQFAGQETSPEDSDDDDPDDGMASGPVVTTVTTARLEAVYDPALEWPLDPEALEGDHANQRRRVKESPSVEEGFRDHIDLQLETGRTLSYQLFLEVPPQA